MIERVNKFSHGAVHADLRRWSNNRVACASGRGDHAQPCRAQGGAGQALGFRIVALPKAHAFEHASKEFAHLCLPRTDVSNLPKAFAL